MAEDVDLTAAEYVLGTLDTDERRAFLATLARDPAAVAAVTRWQQRLAPLGFVHADQPVPPGLWLRIERTLFGQGQPANDNAGSVGGWRVAAIAASLVACATSIFAWQTHNIRAPATPAAVAALTSGGEAPVLLVTYDAARERVRVVPVTIGERPGHSLELWLIAGASAPKSMGTLAVHAARAMNGVRLNPDGASFAVSVEPIGGSPTGAPTGPVVYSGKMLKFAPET